MLAEPPWLPIISEDRTMKDAWNTIETAPADQVVETKLDDEKGERNFGLLKRQGHLWYTPDGSMYVYYTPTHWRSLTNGERRPDGR